MGCENPLRRAFGKQRRPGAMKGFHENRGQLYRIDYDRVQGGIVALPADAPPMAHGTKWAKVVAVVCPLPDRAESCLRSLPPP
jgi:hypothetical protein